jgi:hypothetical protein
MWQGATYYHFCTYDLNPANSNLWANIDFAGDQEGLWNFVSFSYQAGVNGAKGKAVVFLQYGNTEPKSIVHNALHTPVTSYFRFTLGQDSFAVSYPVFNGQFVNPAYGIGKGAFVGTLDAFKSL